MTDAAPVASHPHRMRDLVRLTGVSAPTVHFYAQQGLLPPPQKTAGNQARYAEATVGRLLWIRTVQEELRLSLRSIGWILERWGELPVVEIQTAQAVGRLLDEPRGQADRAALARVQEALEADDLASLQRLGLVASGPTAGATDLHLLELVGVLRAAGFTEEAGFHIEGIALYRDAVERLVEDELRRVVEPVLARHDPATLRDLVHRGLPLANRLLVLLHERAVQDELRRWLDLADDGAARASA